jgi:hypothetical protein
MSSACPSSTSFMPGHMPGHMHVSLSLLLCPPRNHPLSIPEMTDPLISWVTKPATHQFLPHWIRTQNGPRRCFKTAGRNAPKNATVKTPIGSVTHDKFRSGGVLSKYSCTRYLGGKGISGGDISSHTCSIRSGGCHVGKWASRTNSIGGKEMRIKA